jgi:diadenosine tetraphosphate (Ap4A) HIT family hydrolase
MAEADPHAPVVDPACAFCRIVAGELPASVVAEDDELLALMDINPVTPGHLLVIPRGHYADLAALPPALGARMFQWAQQLAAAVRGSGVHCEGVNLFLADGEAAFQEVFHCHLHVIPRYAGDGFRIDADWGRRPEREELDRLAARIRAAGGAGLS